jgi:hypothetical protein
MSAPTKQQEKRLAQWDLQHQQHSTLLSQPGSTSQHTTVQLALPPVGLSAPAASVGPIFHQSRPPGGAITTPLLYKLAA